MEGDGIPKSVLVLGTASHVGKSAIVTGLCRIFSRKYRVAPFKAQNMSLNSWITTDGKEIGIAQAIQAMAAGVEPTAEMNPVLLKPKGDRVSQVILMGKPYADKSAGAYYDSIEETHGVLRQALETLGNDYEVIVMEGAGGAAEINLYERDIVNLGTARITNAPIILVGDIERGGVFASLYGTIQLLPEDVRQNVRGMIINKFRGDPAILQAGVDELEQITGIPVLGVMPYSKLGIPSEDSVSIGDKSSPSGMYDVDVAVIRLPRISNFTDFEPLERLVNIRYVNLDDKLGTPDAVIIPGTKNTISDLQDLLESGMAEKIKSLYRKVPILGICGGYQMLGKKIEDAAIEGEADASYEGLGLLDIHTIFDAYKKKTVQVTKKVNRASPFFDSIKGETICGYEIHMGDTGSNTPVFGDDGCVDESGMVVGTYLHGLFSNANIRKAFVSYLLEKKGIEYNEEDLEDDPYEELAQIMEEYLDIGTIYSILGLKEN
ncbi:cobyric acid synthase [Methanohalophilus euhalobius]|uniref:Probable cobyric acid synthase n=1 Tax=Methanohalophilus euhalobius TaxID=51203 RepID=A0A315A271_9EURY|nr:cobyric acid synthase [Methanohalophilus euhalobius]PQV43608.1 adenosylcobyric acid synthase (glutamine-hydrolysing) [Methanohalophilus euhalobius]RNI12611.1 cobyric acid synthase [Methanohalophilus euhalobius]